MSIHTHSTLILYTLNLVTGELESVLLLLSLTAVLVHVLLHLTHL
jgi:hypothetical protein